MKYNWTKIVILALNTFYAMMIVLMNILYILVVDSHENHYVSDVCYVKKQF